VGAHLLNLQTEQIGCAMFAGTVGSFLPSAGTGGVAAMSKLSSFFAFLAVTLAEMDDMKKRLLPLPRHPCRLRARHPAARSVHCAATIM